MNIDARLRDAYLCGNDDKVEELVNNVTRHLPVRGQRAEADRIHRMLDRLKPARAATRLRLFDWERNPQGMLTGRSKRVGMGKNVATDGLPKGPKRKRRKKAQGASTVVIVGQNAIDPEAVRIREERKANNQKFAHITDGAYKGRAGVTL